MSVKVVVLSDTHSKHHQLPQLPDGDVLIHAGDWTTVGSLPQAIDFLEWFDAQPHSHKLLIAGNHDRLCEEQSYLFRHILPKGITYLENSGVEIEGIKIWGSPVTPAFCNWAFNVDRDSDRMKDIWSLIPLDTEILITHGPAHQILDRYEDLNLGCEVLLDRIAKLDKLKYHIFGHFHQSSGVKDCGRYQAINAAICNDKCKVHNKVKVLDYA